VALGRASDAPPRRLDVADVAKKHEEVIMFEQYRETHDLLVDYAEALRDGDLPTFLKSLSRFEARHVLPVGGFWHAAQIIRTLNSVAFTEGITHPSVDLFLSRVDAKIAARAKNAGKPAAGRTRRSVHR
jgi:hypothetical protein